MKRLIAIALAILAATGLGFGQGRHNYTRTTLGAAIDDNVRLLPLASSTGAGPINNTDISVGGVGNLVRQIAAIDNEFVEIYSAPDSTHVQVVRGVLGTQAMFHNSGANVFFGPPSYFKVNEPSGKCTEAAQPVLPVFSVRRDTKEVGLFTCSNSQWVKGTRPFEPATPALWRECNTALGNAVYTGIGTSTTVAASSTSTYSATLDITHSFLATGLSILKGDTVSASAKKVYAIYSAGGTLIANTATAGTATATTASIFQDIAFTSPVILLGPARYLVVLQGDAGATDKVQMFSTAGGPPPYVATGDLGATTFGTLPATVTVPTTFTTVVGPVACAY